MFFQVYFKLFFYPCLNYCLLRPINAFIDYCHCPRYESLTKWQISKLLCRILIWDGEKVFSRKRSAEQQKGAHVSLPNSTLRVFIEPRKRGLRDYFLLRQAARLRKCNGNAICTISACIHKSWWVRARPWFLMLERRGLGAARERCPLHTITMHRGVPHRPQTSAHNYCTLRFPHARHCKCTHTQYKNNKMPARHLIQLFNRALLTRACFYIMRGNAGQKSLSFW